MHDNERRSNNRQLAIRLAEAKIAIFPSVGKTPVVQAWQRLDTSIPPEDRAQIVKTFIEKHGNEPLYVGCTTDPKIVKELWRKEPDAVPSISCGPSGLVVLDCDKPREQNAQDGVTNIRAFFKDHGKADLSDLPITKTQSSGRHIYYRNTVEHGCASGAFGPMNIQVKGIGGQIVAPGAIREDGARYERTTGTPSLIEAFRSGSIPEVPAYVVDHFRTKVASDKAHVTGDEQSEYERRVREAIGKGLTDYDEVAGPLGFNFDALVEKDSEFKRLIEGRRGESADDKDTSGSGAIFALSRCLHREFGSAFTVEDFAAILINHPDELFGTHCDDRQADHGEFRTYNIARDFLNGRNSFKIVDGDRFGAVADDDYGYDIHPDQRPPANDNEGQKRPTLSGWLSDLLAREPEPVEELIEGVLTAGEVVMTHGQPGAAKTADKINLGMCLAAGLPYHGRDTKPVGVLFVLCENPAEDDRRLRAWIKHHGVDPTALPVRAHLASVRLYHTEGKRTPDERAIVQMASEFPARFGVPCRYIVIDNARHVIAPGNINEDRDAGILGRSLIRIRQATGATVDVIHHNRKGDDTYTGSGALLGFVDSAWGMGLVGGSGTIKFTKLRLGDTRQALHYSLTTETVVKTVDGKPFQTVVAVDRKAALSKVEDDDADMLEGDGETDAPHSSVDAGELLGEREERLLGVVKAIEGPFDRTQAANAYRASHREDRVEDSTIRKSLSRLVVDGFLARSGSARAIRYQVVFAG